MEDGSWTNNATRTVRVNLDKSKWDLLARMCWDDAEHTRINAEWSRKYSAEFRLASLLEDWHHDKFPTRVDRGDPIPRVYTALLEESLREVNWKEIAKRYLKPFIAEHLRRQQEECPGCGCMPGEGITESCNDSDGCGYWRALRGRYANGS
jgi:hypothetical protein